MGMRALEKLEENQAPESKQPPASVGGLADHLPHSLRKNGGRSHAQRSAPRKRAKAEEAAAWKLCASCTELFRCKIAVEIKKIWDDLPRIFSLVPEA